MKKRSLFTILFPALLYAPPSLGGFSNYNSILIGERAAGMGGAYTALSDDPAGGSFYNPASLAWMKGGTLSAAVNTFNKYDTLFGTENSLTQAAFRVNQGSIVPVPASSGTVYSFGQFALGLSIVFPDFEIYKGSISKTETNSSILDIRDESLWIGGSVALLVNPRNSLGLTVYYTSRTYARSISDRSDNGSNVEFTSEEKTYSHNNLVYVLGFQTRINELWSLGFSLRPPSIPISGDGTFLRSHLQSPGPSPAPISRDSLSAETEIPSRSTFGIAFEKKKKWAWSMDLQYHAPVEYRDFKSELAGDLIVHEATWNLMTGAEYYWNSWLALRTGFFTNFSSHPQVPENPTERSQAHVDMWGWSANLALFTSSSSVVTFGGYYTGGKGYSVQQIDQELKKVQKSFQTFAMLVATSFYF